MDAERAQEIIESADEIEVMYDGESVWLDSIDFETKMAVVHTLWSPDEEIEVPVAELQEQPAGETSDFLSSE